MAFRLPDPDNDIPEQPHGEMGQGPLAGVWVPRGVDLADATTPDPLPGTGKMVAGVWVPSIPVEG